jgi:hypothetical protein
LPQLEKRKPDMPGLLDLPPELLEQVSQHLLLWDDRAHLASLRLSCRYVEQAIRHSFRLERFKTVKIREPRDDICDTLTFCSITKIPDLAKAIKQIGIRCADDGRTIFETLPVQQRKASRFMKSVRRLCAMTRIRDLVQILNCIHANHSDQCGSLGLIQDSRQLEGPSEMDQIVPAALVGHKEAFLAAFVAAENVTELDFTDHDEFPSTTAGYEGLRPGHFIPRREPKQVIEHGDMMDFFCDISSTFDFVMSLVARAGLTPRYIYIHPLDDAHMMTGLTSAIGLVAWKQALLQVESLKLAFIDKWRTERSTAEAA